MSGPGLSVWLVPADPTLQLVLDALARAHGAPPFAAHLTLLGGLAPSRAAQASEALAAIAASTPPLAVPLAGAGESDVYFETVFLRCVETPALSALRDRLRAAIGSGAAPAIGPHLSLIYARLPASVRHEIARAHARHDELRFARLALIASGAHGWEPVADWRVIAEHALHG